MMRHLRDYGSCGQENVQTLSQSGAVVVLAVVHSLVITEMEPSFSNLVGRTFKMELIWQHSGKLQNECSFISHIYDKVSSYYNSY
jgi:hypothetical protein